MYESLDTADERRDQHIIYSDEQYAWAHAGDGDDVIRGRIWDRVSGGSGNDLIEISSREPTQVDLRPTHTHTLVEGGPGRDMLFALQRDPGYQIVLVGGDSSLPDLSPNWIEAYGVNNDEYNNGVDISIVGGNSDDVLSGAGMISGGAGNDDLYDGTGFFSGDGMDAVRDQMLTEGWIITEAAIDVDRKQHVYGVSGWLGFPKAINTSQSIPNEFLVAQAMIRCGVVPVMIVSLVNQK